MTNNHFSNILLDILENLDIPDGQVVRIEIIDVPISSEQEKFGDN